MKDFSDLGHLLEELRQKVSSTINFETDQRHRILALNYVIVLQEKLQSISNTTEKTSIFGILMQIAQLGRPLTDSDDWHEHPEILDMMGTITKTALRIIETEGL
jgi:hypothetical protein